MGVVNRFPAGSALQLGTSILLGGACLALHHAEMTKVADKPRLFSQAAFALALMSALVMLDTSAQLIATETVVSQLKARCSPDLPDTKVFCALLYTGNFGKALLYIQFFSSAVQMHLALTAALQATEQAGPSGGWQFLKPRAGQPPRQPPK
jgi:hypothetical protein